MRPQRSPAFEDWRARLAAKRPAALLAVLPAVLTWPIQAGAESALAAVAANFSEVADRLAADFGRATEHQVTVAAASTGKLYAQIRNGAPFDVFLAADRRRPEILERARVAVPGSRITYGFGRLTLWSPNAGLIDADGRKTLQAAKFRRLAMANPELAPYGAAARQTLLALGMYAALRSRIVTGENIGRTYAFVATGNAELGLVALSHVLSSRNQFSGSRWDIPARLHDPIRQDAILLRRGKNNSAARAFLDYLKTPEARETIRNFGYAVE